MKKVILLLLSACSIFACTHTPKWELVWEDNFDGAEPDTSVWSRIPRGKPDWQNTQSFDDRCYEMRNGLLILKGIVNDNTEADAAQYLTGGLWTKDKRAFHGGRIEVRARLHGAKGAWPANDSIVYQTVHSHYTYTLGIENNPKHGNTIPINPEDFNVYGVDFWPDSLVFHVNGKRNFVYPRIETEQEGQFPFNIPQYLLIDMQLGGSWVGTVDPADLPVEMEVDWVRHYQWK